MCSWIETYIKGFVLVTAVLAELGCIAQPEVWSCPEDLHYRLILGDCHNNCHQLPYDDAGSPPNKTVRQRVQ